MNYEILGYLASGFVVVSLVMSNMAYLRYLNLAGSALFVFYGLMINAYPVAIMNGFAVMLNLYHLWKLRCERKEQGDSTDC